MTLSAKQTLSYLDKAQHKVWDFLITYETERITLVKDIKLGVVHKSLLIGVAIYLIYTIITSHAYMVKESPATTVNSWVSEQDFLVKQENVRNGVDGEPDYCDNPSTNYVFDDQFTYLDNKCDFEAIVAEVFDEESTAVSFVTYYQDERLKKVGIGEDANKFIPFVEDLDLFFSHGFTTSLGVSGANVETVLKSRDGGNEKKFEKGQAVTLKVGDLVRMAGVDLNARHVNSGGLDPSKDARSEGWPLFRMTGVDLIVEMNYQNFRSDKPFDFSDRLEAQVSATEGVWVSRGQSIHPLWNSTEDKLIPHQRYPQVISVSYRASGELGKADTFEAVMNIAVSAAIFGVAKFICDSIGDLLVHEFWDKRFLDHGDHLAIKLLKEKVWDDEEKREKSTRHLVSKALDQPVAPAKPKKPRSSWAAMFHVENWGFGKKPHPRKQPHASWNRPQAAGASVEMASMDSSSQGEARHVVDNPINSETRANTNLHWI